MQMKIVADTLYQIARAKHGEAIVPKVDGDMRWFQQDGTKILVFSYKSHFNLLWGLADGVGGLSDIASSLVASCRQEDNPLTLVIVWDDIPKGETDAVDTTRYLTPIDWAVALSLSINKVKPVDRNYPPIRILIHDLGSQNVSHANSVRIYDQFPEFLTWVCLFRLTDNGSMKRDVESLIDNILNAEKESLTPLMNRSRFDNQKTMELIEQLWQGNIIQPMDSADRHAITNLIGVRSLLKAMQSPDTLIVDSDPVIKALEELIQAIGLIPKEIEHVIGTWYPPSKWKGHVDNFILVDDLCDQGWKEFLLTALGVKGSQSNVLKAYTTPEKAILKDGIDLNGNNARKDIIFLDLRLFTNRTKGEETEFFQKILEFYRSHYQETLLPWPGLYQEEIDAIERCIEEKSVENEDYYVALTLFPRLIALCNPRIPIIIFSSTGKKHIVDRLKPYKNIIVEFDKPKYFGQASISILVETKARFLSAMESAISICRGKEICYQLGNTSEADEHEMYQKNDGRYIEVYIDESRDEEQLSVGGLIVSYPSEDAATRFYQLLDDNNIRWGWHRDSPWSVPASSFLDKASNIDSHKIASVLNDVETIALENQIYISACRLGQLQISKAQDSMVQAPDYYYRSLLRLLLETLLLDWVQVPEDSDENVRVAIFAGTRVLFDHSQSFKNSPQNFIDLERAFGRTIIELNKECTEAKEPVWNTLRTAEAFVVPDKFKKDEMQDKPAAFLANGAALFLDENSKAGRTPKELMTYSFAFSEVYPIVLEVLGSRRARNIDIVMARGVRLLYGKHNTNLTPNQLPRQIHYAADYVASRPEQVPNIWWKRGFRDVANEKFHHWMNASYYADDRNTVVESILEWSSTRAHRGVSKYSIARWIRTRLADCERKMAGDEFIRLCKLLHESLYNEKSIRQTGLIVEGTVTKIVEFGVFVSLDDNNRGLIHVSNLADEYVKNIHEYVEDRDIVEVEVIEIKDDGKISLRMLSNISKNEKAASKDDTAD